MNIYPPSFEQKTEFQQIRNLLLNHCLSNLGRQHVESMQFITNYNVLKELLEQTFEFKNICLYEGRFPTLDYYDLLPVLFRLRILGTTIATEELFDMLLSLQTIQQIALFLQKSQETYPALYQLAEPVQVDKKIILKIQGIIDEKGNIKDNASAALQKIRSELKHIQHQIEKKIVQLIQYAKKEGYCDDDADVTIRNQRLVIPLQAAHKRKIKGYVHDESATGHTVFLEPLEIFDMNNEIRELESEEKREIQKILLEFSDFLRPEIPNLITGYEFLGTIDFIRAKALLAVEIEGNKPKLAPQPIMRWNNATHPLLYLSLKKQKKIIVPLYLDVKDNLRMLIISGPNAGGKSVCLKTAGLLQYMMQCGLLVPMDENSVMGIYEQIFIEIGDEQSVENDLSTYSSHLLNMKYFLEHANENTLILIDEMGAGTEPQLGGAIAEAIIEQLSAKQVFAIITTHYTNLKMLAEKLENTANGAMLYDTKKMQPLFQLAIGKPGSSFAFEIARKIGLSETLIENAINKTGRQQIDFEKQLQNLEVEKLTVQKKEQELKVADDFLSEMIDKYQRMTADLELSKKNTLAHAKMQAQKIIERANSAIERAIKEIKECKADKEQTRKVREEIKTIENEILAEPLELLDIPTKEDKKKKKKTISGNGDELVIEHTPLQLGDNVRIKGQSAIGELIEKANDDALVMFDAFKIKTSLSRLEKINKESAQQWQKEKQSQKQKPKLSFDYQEKVQQFNPKLDIRGKKAEEAFGIIQQYIDEAILLSVHEVRILHGKGDGILRNILHNYLRSVPEIKDFYDERLEFGGHGITIIKIL